MAKKKFSSIIIVIERFFPLTGGSETQSFQLAQSLSRRGAKVLVVTKRWRPELPPREIISDQFGVARLGPNCGGRLFDYLSGLELAVFLWKNRTSTDLIFVNGGLANIFGSTAILLGKLMNKKVVARVATPGELFFFGPQSLSPKKFIHPLLRLRLLMSRVADYYIAQTKQIEKEIIVFGIQKGKIRIIPDGVDEKIFRPADEVEKKNLRKKLDLSQQKLIVTYCGRLVKRKGLIFLLQAWDKIFAKPKATVLVLIGSGRNQPDSVEEVLHKTAQDNKNQVLFLGEKEKQDIPLYLRASDVFVYPSILSEGVAFSILEAMSCGLPIVSCNVGGINEVIRNGKTGILVKKENPRVLAQAISRLVADQDSRNRLGKEARIEVEKRYSLSKIMKTYYEFLDDICRK